MTSMGLRGVVRGRAMKTTIPDASVPCPRDKVNCKFRAPAPNMLWVSDFTYVSTWQGFVYVAFINDTFANRIVGWKVSRPPKTDFVLNALEQALYARRPAQLGGVQLSFEPMARWLHSTTATGGANTYRSDTPNGWEKQASKHPLAASETPMTTLWLKRSTVFTKPR